jgi:hypothetical protein
MVHLHEVSFLTLEREECTSLCYFDANGQPHSTAKALIIIALGLSFLRLGCSLINLIT